MRSHRAAKTRFGRAELPLGQAAPQRSPTEMRTVESAISINTNFKLLPSSFISLPPCAAQFRLRQFSGGRE